MDGKYLIVSDLHLTDIENNSDGWKNYKHSSYSITKSFESLLKNYEDNNLTLIFNGDVIDFDLVVDIPIVPDFDISSNERKRGLYPTEEKSLWKLKRVLYEQEDFFKLIALFLSRGNKLIYVIGNHDRELYFEKLQSFFIDYIIELANNNNMASLNKEQISFYSWFYYKKGEIYVEHGNQYDYYTSFKYLLKPTIMNKGVEEIALPMGNLSNRYLMTSMGFFNPHASDYILSGFAYFKHWLTKYAFSKRSLMFNWIWGSILVMFKIFSTKKKQNRAPKGYDELLKQEAAKFNITIKEIDRLNDLRQLPIAYRTFRIIKELWLDRVFLSFILIGGTIALALVPIPLWIKLMVPLSSFPLLFFIYEMITKGETIFTIEEKIPNYAKKIANIVDTRAIIFGHSHKPRYFPLNKNTIFIDSGTWAPVFSTKTPKILKEGLRNYIYIDVNQNKYDLKSFLSEEERLIIN
jgi:UDP-2,3-diacylglucosamine pyrophosphatase LpxH